MTSGLVVLVILAAICLALIAAATVLTCVRHGAEGLLWLAAAFVFVIGMFVAIALIP